MSHQVVLEFNQRKKEIQRLNQEHTVKSTALERHQSEIEEIRQAWIGPLQDLISRINANFSHFMKCLKCAGEVDLNIPENHVSCFPVLTLYYSALYSKSFEGPN